MRLPVTFYILRQFRNLKNNKQIPIHWFLKETAIQISRVPRALRVRGAADHNRVRAPAINCVITLSRHRWMERAREREREIGGDIRDTRVAKKQEPAFYPNWLRTFLNN